MYFNTTFSCYQLDHRHWITSVPIIDLKIRCRNFNFQIVQVLWTLGFWFQSMWNNLSNLRQMLHSNLFCIFWITTSYFPPQLFEVGKKIPWFILVDEGNGKSPIPGFSIFIYFFSKLYNSIFLFPESSFDPFDFLLAPFTVPSTISDTSCKD